MMGHRTTHILFIILMTSSKVETSIVYMDKQKWKDAITTCANNGGTLVDDVTQYTRQDTVWTGGYTYFSWRVTMGCFMVGNQNLKYSSEDEINTCQDKCKSFDYFAVKENRSSECICLENINRNNKQEYHPCDCDSCFQVFKHRLKLVNEGDMKNEACMTVTCVSDRKTLKEEPCDKYYEAICDNGQERLANDVHQSQKEICNSNSSFIKWMYDNICDNHFNGYLWTSGSRSIIKSVVRNDATGAFTLIKCEMAKWNDKKGSYEHKQDDCDSKHPFYCEINNFIDHTSPTTVSATETDRTKGFMSTTEQTVSSPSSSSQIIGNMTEKKPVSEKSQTQPAAIVAGVIVPVIAIILIVIFVVVLRRRSGAQVKKDQMSNNQYVYSNANSNRIENRPFSVANKSYDDINDGFRKQTNGKMLSPNYGLENDAINVKKGTMPALNNELAKDISKNNTPDNYDFAQPISNESDYAYNSDYDHLNRILKTKTESDYALTCPKKQYERDSKTYDTFASSNTSDGQQASSDYDHLPTVIGSDPTYDCAALKSRKQDENNYDSFNQY